MSDAFAATGGRYKSTTTSREYVVIGKDPIEPWKWILEDSDGFRIAVGRARLLDPEWFTHQTGVSPQVSTPRG